MSARCGMVEKSGCAMDAKRCVSQRNLILVEKFSENGLDPNFGERKTTWQNVRSLSRCLSFESRATRGIRPAEIADQSLS